MAVVWTLICGGIIFYLIQKAISARRNTAERMYWANVKMPIIVASWHPFDDAVEQRAAYARQMMVECNNQFKPPVWTFVYSGILDRASTIGEDFNRWQILVQQKYLTDLRAWHQEQYRRNPDATRRHVEGQQYVEFDDIKL